MLNHAYLIKGFLLAKDAPNQILAAIEAMIESVASHDLHGSAEDTIKVSPLVVASVEDVANDDAVDFPDKMHGRVAGQTDDKPQKKSRDWSPEQRAAAAERMRLRQANGGLRRKPEVTISADEPQPETVKPYAPVTVDKLLTDHDGYAGKRDPGQPLTDEDWPDIKARLAKSPDRESIAGDYDVDIEDLNFFIQSCERREQRSGEAQASQPSRASGATKSPTW